MGAPTIVSGLNTTLPVTFYRGSDGALYMVNGYDRPRRWKGGSTAMLAGITAPAAPPSVTAGGGGGATAGDYIFAYRYIDAEGIPSSISDLHTVTAADNDKFTWSSISAGSETRVTHVELWRSTSGQAQVLYRVATIAVADVGAGYEDTADDDTISSQSSDGILPILLPDGSLNARRFGVPPSTKPVGVTFQDRVFLLGVTSNWGERNVIYFSEEGEPESMPATNILTMQDNTGDEDGIVGAMPFGSYLVILKDRHLYSLTFVRQPKIDAEFHLLAWRGCLNQRCWAIQDGIAYLMDACGIYAFTGSVAPIDGPIANLFDDRIIDLTKSKWFSAVSDPVEKLVYFNVAFVGDSGTRPTRSLVFHTETKVWSIDKYPLEIGGGCNVPVAGHLRTVFGAENDLILATGQGTSDLVAAVRGSVTSATSNTLTDSAATFSGLADAPVAIVAGTGAGQIRRISSHTSTELTITPNWTTTPDATSVYLVGAIEWNHKTGLLSLPETETRYKRSFVLRYSPTTNANTVGMKFFKNHVATAVAQVVDADLGTGVTTVAGDATHTFNIKSDRFGLGSAPGRSDWSVPGIVDDRTTTGDRWIAFELSGFQGQDQITIYGYDINGVEV